MQKIKSEILLPWQRRIQCKICKDIIYSRWDGEFRSCKCKAIAVDQTPYYGRHLGIQENFIDLENKSVFVKEINID